MNDNNIKPTSYGADNYFSDENRDNEDLEDDFGRSLNKAEEVIGTHPSRVTDESATERYQEESDEEGDLEESLFGDDENEEDE